MSVFVVVINDRHIDTRVEIFSDAKNAVKSARELS